MLKFNGPLVLNNVHYEVFNSMGNLVKTGIITKDNLQLDLSTVLKGLYFLKISDDNTGYSKLLIL